MDKRLVVKFAFEAAGLHKLANVLSDAAWGAGIGSLGLTGAAALQGKPGEEMGEAALRGAAAGAVVGGGTPTIVNLIRRSRGLAPYARPLGEFGPALGLVPLIMADKSE